LTLTLILIILTLKEVNMTRNKTMLSSVAPAVVITAVLFSAGCQPNPDVSEDERGAKLPLPLIYDDDAEPQTAPQADETEAGDYSKPERWIVAGGDKTKRVDIFLATPTGNISGGASYASFEDAKKDATSWQRSVEGLFKDVTNIYHPVYRYACISGCSGASMDATSTNDIIAAFEYYWENYNKGQRPFILLGFSQGAYVLWNLVLQKIDKNPDMQKYHILTYALGSPGRGTVGKTGGSASEIRNRMFSQSPTDLNKVICFSPYHKDDDVSGMGAAFKVTGGSPTSNPITNPVTWTTDADFHACTNCTNVTGAQVDYAKGVLIVETTRSANGSWGYHGQETTFFAGPIKQNIIDRIAAWEAAYPNTTSIREPERRIGF
jgi:hypothetical protein